jgi:hypothetical protein
MKDDEEEPTSTFLMFQLKTTYPNNHQGAVASISLFLFFDLKP